MALIAAGVSLTLAMPTWGSSGTWERAWGEDVVQTGMPGDTGVGFEICTIASVCKPGIQSEPALGGDFNVPQGVAADAAGNVYVADRYNRIQKFNSAGVFERAWGKDVVSSGPGNTGTGFEICVAANGDVCKAGLSTTSLGGEMQSPRGVSTDPAGNVYVADTNFNRIQKFSPNGVFERAWGEDVIGSNATGGFEVCVAGFDTCQSGNNATALGGDLDHPAAVGTDTAGNVYVADTNRHRVQKFSSAGAFERAWGEDVVNGGGTSFEICVANVDACKAGVNTAPALGGELNAPAGVAADTAGNVYVGDTNHNRVQKFNSLGVFERGWGKNVVSAGPDDTGTGFETCVAANADVCKTGEFTTQFGGEFSAPVQVGTDAAANVYVADNNSGRVQRFNSAGAFERLWGKDVVSSGPGNTGTGFEICVAASGDTCKIAGGSSGLGGEMGLVPAVASDPAGDVYVGESQHRVQKFAADSVPSGGGGGISNEFTIGKLRKRKLRVIVFAPGVVEVTAKKLLKPSSASGGPGTIVVTLRLTKAASQTLRRSGKVKVKARITFTPTGGTPNSKTRKLKIRKR